MSYMFFIIFHQKNSDACMIKAKYFLHEETVGSRGYDSATYVHRIVHPWLKT